mgnify:CR=1 FL=1
MLALGALRVCPDHVVNQRNYIDAETPHPMTTTFTPATGPLASLDLLQVSVGGPVLHVRLNR